MKLPINEALDILNNRVYQHNQRIANNLFNKANYVFDITNLLLESSDIPLIKELVQKERALFRPYIGEIEKAILSKQGRSTADIHFEEVLYSKHAVAMVNVGWFSDHLKKYIVITDVIKDISRYLEDPLIAENINYREIFDWLENTSSHDFYHDVVGIGGIKDAIEYLRLYWSSKLQDFISEDQFIKVMQSNFTPRNIIVILEMSTDHLRNELWNNQYSRVLPAYPTVTYGNLTVKLNRELSHLREHSPVPTSINVTPNTYYASRIKISAEEFEGRFEKNTISHIRSISQ